MFFKLRKGCEQAIKKCLKVKKGENVVLVADYGSKKIAESLVKVVKEVGREFKIHLLEEYGKRPLTKLPREIEDDVKRSDVIIYMASSQPGEKNSLRKPIIDYIKKDKREAHMPDISKKLMETGMCTDYDLIKDISKKVFDFVHKSKEIRVTTEAGTDFIVKFTPKYKWYICDGDLSKKGIWSNLPDGEVFTCEWDFNGKVVADGVLGDYFGKYGLIKKNPVVMEVKNGRVVKLECKNKDIEKELREYIKQDKNANRIGEFAIGTNIGLKKLVGNLLQDEKFPGVHIAVGSGYPDITGAKWDSKAHCDMVLLKTNIFVDGKELMKDGRFRKF